MSLTEEQLAQYHCDGYVVVENLIDPERVESLRTRTREYTHGGRESGSLIVQIEPRVSRGMDRVTHPGDAIRKIDGLVRHDDLFRSLGTAPEIVGVITQILGPDVKMFRNSLLMKPPNVGSSKGMHQDAPYWPIKPMSECSCWFALDDATPQNGCMAVIPGAHKHGALPHKKVPDDYVIDETSYSMEELTLAPLKAGGGLFFHALLPHCTAPNSTSLWRRAIALSYMSARSYYTGEGIGPEFLSITGSSFPGCVR